MTPAEANQEIHLRGALVLRVDETTLTFILSSGGHLGEAVVVTVSDGHGRTVPGTFLTNGHFVFMDNPFWLGDLFSDIPVGSFFLLDEEGGS